MHHPKVLFLDEPTIGLDPQTRKPHVVFLRNLNQTDGTTIFLTTHYMEEAEHIAGRVAVIDHGKIIDVGSSNELKERTKTATLEEAFLALTGNEIREEHGSNAGQRMQMWHGGRR